MKRDGEFADAEFLVRLNEFALKAFLLLRREKARLCSSRPFTVDSVHPLTHGKLANLVFASARAYLVCMNDVARTLFLVCYDIGSPKRLHRVHKYLLGYRVGGQKSFFECWLTPAELREVRQTLDRLLEPAQDRAHIFQLDPRMKSDGLGLAKQPVTNVFMIV